MAEQVESTQKSTLQTVGRNTGILFASQTVTWLISAFVMAIVPRLLGPVALGQLAIPAALWAIATVFVGWGTSRLATLDAARDPSTAGRIVRPAIRMRLLFGVVALVVLVVVSAVLYSREVVIVTVIVGVATIIYGVAEVWRAVLTGLERAGTMAQLDIAGKLITAVVTISVVVATRDLYATAAAGVVSALAVTAITTRVVSAQVDTHDTAAGDTLRTLIRRGSPFLMMGVALIAYQQVDIVVMSMLVDDRQIGWYGAADRLFGTLLFAPAIMMTALLPALTREHHENHEQARTTVGRAFDLLVVVAVPIGLLTILCANPFVELLYGDEFIPAGDVLAVYGVVLLFTFFSMLFGSYCTASNRQRLWNVVVVVAVIASIGLDLVLVPLCDRAFDNGALGGALAFVVTEAGMVVFGFWKVAPGMLTRRRLVRIGKCLVGGGALLAVAWLFRGLFFLVPAAAGGLAYLAAIAVMRILDQQEVAALRSMLSRRS